MNDKELKQIEKLMNELYKIDAKDVDINFDRLNEKVRAHNCGEDVFNTKSEYLTAVISTFILDKRQKEIAEITARTTKEVNAARPAGRDLMVQDYAEEVIETVFKDANDGTEEINDIEDLRIAIEGMAETYGEEYGSEFIRDVIDAVHKNEDVIAFREKLQSEQALTM